MKKLISICAFLMLVSGIYAIGSTTFTVSGIKYNTLSANTVEVTSNNPIYTGSIIIPSTVVYGGVTYSVTTIGFGAFGGCGALTSVNIPNTVTTIGINAFNSCGNLTSINVPSSVTSIQGAAFFACSKLTSITIPSSVTSIPDYAFGNSVKIKTVTCLSSTPPSLGSECFMGITAITDVFVPTDAAVTAYKADAKWIAQFPGTIIKKMPPFVFTVDGIKYSTTSENTVEVVSNAYTGDIAIPASVVYGGVTYNVTAIGDQAFFNLWDLTSVSIPNSVTSIGYKSFSTCQNLTTISIPNSVTSIGIRAFECNPSIASITLPSLLTSIADHLFHGCNILSSVSVPSTVTSIGEYSFYGCKLTSFTIPSSVISIGASAFQACNNLTVINCLSTTPPTITGSSFIGIHCITDVFVPSDDAVISYKGNSVWFTLFPLTTIKKVVPPSFTVDGVKYSVTSSNTVEVVSVTNNSGSITIPTEVTYSGVIYTVSTIGIEAFYTCNFTSITIPKLVTSIGNYAFYGCTSLTSLTCLSSTPPTLGNFCFSGGTPITNVFVPTDAAVTSYNADTKWIAQFPGPIIKKVVPLVFTVNNIKYSSTSENTLEVISVTNNQGSITIPSEVTYSGVTYSVTSIGNQAFYACDFSSITIPNTITSIGTEAFFGCYITSFTIPSAVTSIGNSAFGGTSLTTLTCLCTTPPTLGSNCFSGVTTITNVYVPSDAAVTAYNADGEWSAIFTGTIIKKNTLTGFANLVNNKVKISTTASKIVIDGLGIGTTVELYNMNGMRIQSEQSQGNESMSISALPQGLYIVKLITVQGTVKRKVVLQ